MLVSLFDFLTLRRPPMGRMLFALNRILELSDEEREPGLAALIVQAQRQGRKASNLQIEWDRQKKTRSVARGNARVVDSKFDQAWNALWSALQGPVMLDLNDELSETAKKMIDVIFPMGLGAFTTLPFELQLDASDGILEKLDSDHQQEIEFLGLGRYVERIRELGNELRVELAKFNKDLEWEDVAHEQNLARDLYAGVILNVLGRYPHNDKVCVKRRSELLEEVLRQDRILHDNNRRRRPTADLDPDTGELLSTDEWSEELENVN